MSPRIEPPPPNVLYNVAGIAGARRETFVIPRRYGNEKKRFLLDTRAHLSLFLLVVACASAIAPG